MQFIYDEKVYNEIEYSVDEVFKGDKMKRPVAIIIMSMFLLQGLTSIEFIYKANDHGISTAEVVIISDDTKNDAVSCNEAYMENCGTRSEPGGSWNDDFNDDSKIEWNENTNILQGNAILSYGTLNWEQITLDTHPSARIGHSMAPIYNDDKVILFGGWDGNNYLNDTWLYDLSDNKWTLLNPNSEPSGRRYHSMSTIYNDDKVFLFGGYDANNDDDETWWYDLSDNEWTGSGGGARPTARCRHAIASIYGDDKVILYGGSSDGGETWMGDFWNADGWTKKNPPSNPAPIRIRHVMGTIYDDDKIFLFGGDDASDYYNETWIYDLSADQWTNKNPVNYPCARINSAVGYVYNNDKIILFGGKNQTTKFDDTWEYDHSENTWKKMQFQNHPSARYCHSMSPIWNSDKILLFGGDDGAYDDETWILDRNASEKSGMIVSEDISLPQYYSWDSLDINKTEFANHYVNVSIIDNATNQTIQGFGNISANGSIDISSLDCNQYPIIRLKAAFNGNGSDTPILHYWGVNWTNNPPVLGEPTGLVSINRTENLNVSIPVSDFEEKNSGLKFSLDYKLHSSPTWIAADGANITFNATRFYFNITPPANADVGWYDMRFRLNDSLDASSGWCYYNNSLEISNNLPIFEKLDISANVVNRTSNATFTLLKISDKETPFESMNITLLHRLNGTAEWNESYFSVISKEKGNLSLRFTPGSNAILGLYDMKVSLDDGDDNSVYIYPKKILVKNNLPSFDGIDISSFSVNRTSNLIISLLNISDIETPFESMNVTLGYRLNGTFEWNDEFISVNNSQDGNISLHFTPDVNASTGLYDLKVELDDDDNVTVHVYPNYLSVKNNQPKFDGLDISAFIVNRTSNMTITLKNISDIETPFESLNITLWHRLNGTVEWNDGFISIVGAQDRNLTLCFTPTTEGSLGLYDIKVELDDGENVTEYVYPNQIHVKNNLPLFDGLNASAHFVNRTSNVTVILLNISDIETSFESMNVSLWHRLNGTFQWKESFISIINRQGGNLTLRFTPPFDAQLGLYDLKVELDDGDNVSIYKYPNYISVKNVLPSIGNLYPEMYEVFRLSSIVLSINNLSDAETQLDEIGISLFYRLNGTSNWNDSWMEGIVGSGADRICNFSPSASAPLGCYDFRVELDDDDDVVILYYPNLVLVKNVLPVMSILNVSQYYVLRTASLNLTIKDVTDAETAIDQLEITIRTQENGTDGWENLSTVLEYILGSNLTFQIAFDTSAYLSPRDVEVTIDDGDDTVTFVFYDVFSLTNNPPLISENLTYLKLWENRTGEFTLAGMGTDVEDDVASLVWTFNASTINSTLLENIFIDGLTLTIVPVKGATGTDDVEFRLTDLDGDYHVKNILIEVVPDGQRLAAFLTYPENGSLISGNMENLTWKSFMTDSNSSVIFDVYLGDNLSAILEFDRGYLRSNTTETYLVMTGLESGMKYYWCVMPRNETSSGICIPRYSCFEVSIGNRPPTVELVSPDDGSSIDVTSVELSWFGSDPENGTLSYFVYVSTLRSDVVSEASAALMDDTEFAVHTLTGLEKGKTYYWTVRPYDGESIGACLSGIWNFTVSEVAVEPPEVELKAHSSEIFAGEKVTFTIIGPGSRDALMFRVNFQDGTTSEWTTERKITHNYEKAGRYSVSLTALVNGIEAPIPGKTVITVVDSAVLGLIFVQPVDIEDEFITISGSITGITWISENISLVAEVNGRTVDISPALSWSGQIPRDYLIKGNNTITVKLLFKGEELKKEERSIVISALKTTGENSFFITGIWIGSIIIILVLIIVLFLIFRRRKKEQKESRDDDIDVDPPDISKKEKTSKEEEGERSLPEVIIEDSLPESSISRDELPPHPFTEMSDKLEISEASVEVVREEEEIPPIEEPEPETPPLPPPEEKIELKPVPESMGNMIPGYILTHRLGSGGFATVYLALNSKGEKVAVKLPKLTDETLDMSVLHKFKAEADIWKKLKHKNIVTFYTGDIRPVPYMVIEYMKGGNLLKVLKGEPIPIDVAISLIQEVLSGMAYAHRMASVHRDLKPENILFTEDGVPKISDWGIGKFMASESTEKTMGTKGTLVYSAPEQVSPKKYGEVDWSTDVFQLGIMFYELLTGVNPFRSDDPVGIINNIVNEIPMPPSSLRSGIPPEVDAVILRALEKEKENRFISADTMLAELKRGLKDRERNITKYKGMLKRALKDGTISAEEEEMLEGMREHFSISIIQHEKMLRELMP